MPSKFVKVVWKGPAVKSAIRAEVVTRMHEATAYLKSKVQENISKPVTRSGKGTVVQRSVPGEFPRAETKELRNTIMSFVNPGTIGDIQGIVGSPQDYAVPLEVDLDREFLTRTLFEEIPAIRAVFSRKMR